MTSVTFSDATATFYQTYNGNWLPSQMIDGIISTGDNGWAIYRFDGQSDQTLSETALLTLASPVAAGPQTWTITINQNYVGGGGGAHLLGDFSLGYTTDATPDLSSAFTPFTITAATSLNGSTLTSLGNGELLDSGLLPITDVYTITVTSNSADPITGLFLNAINDPTNGLPTGGPGRYYGDGLVGQGNFVVSELTADVSASTTAPVQFGSSYYVYISDPGISWAPAEAAAESMTYLGATGYLATVTSAAENNFLLSLVPTTYSDFSGAWLGGEVFGGVGPGGSQSGTDGGSAYWEVGPLAGQLFSVGQDAVPGAYANWGGWEPNNSYTGSAVYMNVGGTGWTILNGQWADAFHGLASGDPYVTGDNMVGYFVEFTPVDTAPNDHAPVITTAPTQTVAENTTFVAALTSTDVDAVGINPAQFSITGGTDAALFDIVEGNLVFKAAPDYETDPHSYQVEASAFDGTNTTTELITVNVTNVPGAIINGTNQNDIINATTTVAGQPLPTNEEDTINAGGGKDTINALGGNDFINGGAGADKMFGGTGNDTYVVDNTGDIVNETGGNGLDTVQSSITFSLSDAVHAIGAIENLTLTGIAKINGTGNALANEIIGNSGNNILNGLGGADILTGGQGSDKFVFTALAHSTPSASDLITDFVTGSDIIDFSTIDANTSKGGNQAFAFGGHNANVVANSVTWVESSGNTIVQADANGDTTADLQIVLLGTNLNLHVTDFIL